MNIVRISRVSKLLSISAFIFILINTMILVKYGQTDGYEVSIYETYPLYFFILIIATTICSILILINLSQIENKSNYWVVALGISAISNGLFLGLPYFRGYFFYPRGDALSHIGMMKDIIQTGHIGVDNFYPMIHIVGVYLVELTNFDYSHITILLYILLSTMYLFNLYLVARVIATTNKQFMFILSFSVPLMFSYLHTTVHPSMYTIYLTPLALYMYHKRIKYRRNRIIYAFLLILVAVAITLGHPITSIFVIITFLAVPISEIIYGNIRNSRQLNREVEKSVKSSISFIMAVVFLFWYSYYSVFSNFIAVLNYFIMDNGKTSLYEAQTHAISIASLTIYEVVNLFIFKYGGLFLYSTISAIAVLIVLKWCLNRNYVPELEIISYSFLFILSFLVSLFSLLGYTGEYDPMRISRFFLVISPILIGLTSGKLLDISTYPYIKKYIRKMIYVFIILSIISSVVLNTYNIYGSPETLNQNWQLTKMEVIGAEWFSKHNNNKIPTSCLTVIIRRLEDFNFGKLFPYEKRAKLDDEALPPHFGYDRYDTIASIFNESRYLVISEVDRKIEEFILKQTRSVKKIDYCIDDFNKLDNDSSINKIYSNNELEVFMR